MAIPATCITVIDEAQSSASNATITSDWDSFRTNFPQRIFWLLDPGGGGGFFLPNSFLNDPLANGPITVARDNGNVANRSDWFAICNLAVYPPGTLISLAVDTSGSMTLGTVQASYNYFIQRCNAAGFTLVVDTTFPNERWAPPHNKTISPSGSISASPNPISTNIGTKPTESTLTWNTSGEVTSVEIDQGIGFVGDSGTLLVSPDVTTVYTLTIRGAAGGETIETTTLTVLPPPSIFSFTYSPDPQTSGTLGTPSSTITFNWSTLNGESASINQSVGAVSINGSKVWNTGLQSTALSNSPATRTYTFTLLGVDGSTLTSDVTVSVYNDNTPSAFNIPDQTNLQPNTSYVVTVNNITTIDMITLVTGLNGAQVAKAGGSYASTALISPGDTVNIRFISPALNLDPAGLTNSTTYGVTIGTVTDFFDAVTRPPDIAEEFNLANKSDALPYPDIDTIPSPSPNQFIVSDTLPINDIEISVPVKTDKPDTQIRVSRTGSGGIWETNATTDANGWRNTGSI